MKNINRNIIYLCFIIVLAMILVCLICFDIYLSIYTGRNNISNQAVIVVGIIIYVMVSR